MLRAALLVVPRTLGLGQRGGDDGRSPPLGTAKGTYFGALEPRLQAMHVKDVVAHTLHHRTLQALGLSLQVLREQRRVQQRKPPRRQRWWMVYVGG